MRGWSSISYHGQALDLPLQPRPHQRGSQQLLAVRHHLHAVVAPHRAKRHDLIRRAARTGQRGGRGLRRRQGDPGRRAECATRLASGGYCRRHRSAAQAGAASHGGGRFLLQRAVEEAPRDLQSASNAISQTRAAPALTPNPNPTISQNRAAPALALSTSATTALPAPCHTILGQHNDPAAARCPPRGRAPWPRSALPCARTPACPARTAGTARPCCGRPAKQGWGAVVVGIRVRLTRSTSTTQPPETRTLQTSPGGGSAGRGGAQSAER